MTVSGTTTSHTERLADLGEWLHKEMERWRVPGVAAAVVTPDEVLLAEGYGLRDVEKNLPVNADTLFAIGSCTKAFTTFGMGLLVDEGKLDWDKPVREYLPDFRLYDPVATEFVTPRDLASHRTGLPRHDLMWYSSASTREELYSRLRYLKPNKSFRQRYEYQNLMFMTAGYLVGRIAGTTWEEFTQTCILDRLGMKRSNFSVTDSERDANASLPYGEEKGEVKAIPFRNLDAAGPAGSINSSINEMIPWLQMHMNGGKHNGEQLIDEKTLREMHTPQTVMPITPDMPWYGSSEVENTAYGLGWAVQTYRGHTMMRHTGGIDGFISSVSFFPHDGFGVIVLTNLGNTFPATVFALNLFDRMLGLDQIGWSDRLKKHELNLQEAGLKQREEALQKRKPNTAPSHALAEYAGDYEHPGYGTVNVVVENEQMSLRYNALTFQLAHYHYNTFQMTSDDMETFTLLQFNNNPLGTLESLRVTFEPAIEPIEFRRKDQS